jgi:peroxiredoxin
MVLQVGEPAIDFKLTDHMERTIRLCDYLGKRNVVLVFFPLAWTPI